jgi:hypothetical protein
LITSIPFVGYSNPYEPFRNKDARLLASVVVPGSQWASTTIMIQGGLITSEGKPYLYVEAPEGESKKGDLTYSSWGPITKAGGGYADPGNGGYSGFNISNNPIGSHEDNVNYSTSGFSIRKFANEGGAKEVAAERTSTTTWIDFRLAEIYLNYAEAVVESGQGNATTAAGYLNAIRRRAAHMDNIPLNSENVMKERRVELAFEGHRFMDLFRRREYHLLNTSDTRIHALVPMIDLRGSEAQYVFLRMDYYYDIRSGGRNFQTNRYYYTIPDYSASKLVGNPGQE